MCFFKAPKITTQAVTPNAMAALPANAVAPEPEAPVFGAEDENGEQAKQASETKGKTGMASLKITRDPVNVAGANLQLNKTSGLKVA